jgi:hypothetical protein
MDRARERGKIKMGIFSRFLAKKDKNGMQIASVPGRPDRKTTFFVKDVYLITGIGVVPVGIVKEGNLRVGMKLNINGTIMTVKTIETSQESIQEAKQRDEIAFSVGGVNLELQKALLGSANKAEITFSEDGSIVNQLQSRNWGEGQKWELSQSTNGKFEVTPFNTQKLDKETLTRSIETIPVTCMVCHKQTPVPTSNPSFGTSLRCVHCQSPLIRVSEPEQGSPLSTSPELLQRIYGYSGLYLDHPRCPWCKKINYSIVFPADGRFIGWYAVRNPENPQAFRIDIKCIHCGKGFHVEWDKNPL